MLFREGPERLREPERHWPQRSVLQEVSAPDLEQEPLRAPGCVVPAGLTTFPPGNEAKSILGLGMLDQGWQLGFGFDPQSGVQHTFLGASAPHSGLDLPGDLHWTAPLLVLCWR